MSSREDKKHMHNGESTLWRIKKKNIITNDTPVKQFNKTNFNTKMKKQNYSKVGIYYNLLSTAKIIVYAVKIYLNPSNLTHDKIW